MTLAGRTALVTDSTKGIGRPMAAPWRFDEPRVAPAGRIDETETRPVVEELVDEITGVPPPWMTFLWNCDCHTFEQVARQLMKAIECSYDDGMTIAWRVHTEGKAAVRVGPRAECERVARVLAAIGLEVSVVEA